jgi:hypothetical protein
VVVLQLRLDLCHRVCAQGCPCGPVLGGARHAGDDPTAWQAHGDKNECAGEEACVGSSRLGPMAVAGSTYGGRPRQRRPDVQHCCISCLAFCVHFTANSSPVQSSLFLPFT